MELNLPEGNFLRPECIFPQRNQSKVFKVYGHTKVTVF